MHLAHLVEKKRRQTQGTGVVETGTLEMGTAEMSTVEMDTKKVERNVMSTGRPWVFEIPPSARRALQV